MTLMNKFTHITKLKLYFEAELRGTNPEEIRSFLISQLLFWKSESVVEFPNGK